MNSLATFLEVEVELEFAVLAGCAGAADRFGAPLEPESAAEVELLGVVLIAGRRRIPMEPREFDRAQRERWQREVLESLEKEAA